MIVHPVTKYATAVVYGELREQCGIWEYLSCKRHLDDLEKSKKDDYPYIFDETRADRIYRHFALIPRLDIEGAMIELEDWQQFDYGCMMGWVSKKTGKRRFKRAYQRIARGHAKTTVAAGVGLYFMCGDAMYPPNRPELAEYELEPSINIVATDRAQGSRARNDIAGMALRTPALAKRLDIKKTYIRHKTRGGEVIVYSREANNKDGGRPSLVITEEWHAHVTSDIRNVAVSSMGKKRQCLELIITTAGTDAENKPCYQDDLQYKAVLEGTASQEDVFIMIREIDDDDNPHDESCWCKANAFFRNNSEYGKQLYETVKSEYDDAYANGNHAKIREWLIKRMNRWQADAENKYFSGCMDKFKELCIPVDEFRALTKGTRGHYGFDLGKTRDLSGVAYVTQLKDSRLAIAVHGFIPQNSAEEHARTDRVPYLEWAREGYITLTPGDVTDNRYVEQWIYDCEDDRRWGVEEIDYDGHNAVDLGIRLTELYGENKVVEIPQTCNSLNNATKRFRELVLQGHVVAENSPLLIWCLNNAIEVINNYGDIKLSKRHKDDTQRIDPVAAMINALTRLITKVDNNIDISAHIKARGYAIK